LAEWIKTDFGQFAMNWESEALALLELLKMLVLEPRTAVLMALLTAAAWIDLSTHRIPNLLVLTGTLFAVSYNGFYPIYHSQNGWLVGLAGLCVGFIAFFPLYLLRVMGAGDVKLMAMVGAFLGPWPAILAVLWSCVAGGVIALAFLLWTGNVRRALSNIVALMRGNVLMAPIGHLDLTVPSSNSAGQLPYGVAIAAGSILFLLCKQLGFVS
jgi:prepilin peptidase CpaA